MQWLSKRCPTVFATILIISALISIFLLFGGVINGILLLVLLGASYFIMTLGQIGQNTVVREVNSPSGTYTAVLINSDQGALGGDTLVEVVYNSSAVNVLFGNFIKIKLIYSGDWGEFEDMVLEWSSENTLLINGIPYRLS